MHERIWGDRKRERKGRLVKEWRNIISLSSRRGFVLHRLPSAPLHPPPLLGNLCYSEPSTVALATRYACASECVLVQSRAGPFLTSSVNTVCFRGCADSDSALFGSALPFPRVPNVALQRTPGLLSCMQPMQISPHRMHV